MYGIFTYIWLIFMYFMVNVGKYTWATVSQPPEPLLSSTKVQKRRWYRGKWRFSLRFPSQKNVPSVKGDSRDPQ